MIYSMSNQLQYPFTKEDNLLCPSYICKPGAELYGVVNASGFIN